MRSKVSLSQDCCLHLQKVEIHAIKLKVHLTPKIVFRLNKFCYHLEHLFEKIFSFGKILDFLCPVKFNKNLVQVPVRGTWGEP